MKKENRWFL